MSRADARLLSSFPLVNEVSCFTGMYAFVPCVLKPYVSSASTDIEPGTAVTTTTHFPRLLDGAAFEAYGTDSCQRSFWCFREGIG